MGASTKGYMAIAVEPTANTGRQTLLASTAVASTLSLTTQPSSFGNYVQMYLHVIVSGHTASGTVAIAGKKADGATVVTDTSPTLAAATATQPTVEYCTPVSYGSVNASGITTTGLTGGTITVYGVYAATKLIPVDFNVTPKFDIYSPQDHRGIQYKHFRIQQLNKHVTLDKFESALYPESDLWWPFACINSSPTTATIPASPTVLLAVSAVSGAPFSLTTQPTSPGMLLQLVVTSTAVFGTVTVAGTNPYGESITETVNCYGGAGTFYTQNVFASVNSTGVSLTGLTAGSLAINGIFGTQWTFKLPATAFSSLALGIFSGTESAVYPFTFLHEGNLDMDVSKELKLQAKVTSQDQVILGDRTTNPLNSSRLPTYGQPFDLPVAGWPALIYIDPLSGTAMTTQFNDLETVKITVQTGLKETFTALNQQVFSRVYSEWPEATFEGTVDFTNLAQFELFRQNVKQLFGIKFLGGWIGTSAGTPQYKYWQFTLPAKYEMFDIDRSKEKVMAKLKGTCEYEPTLGYALKLDIVNQLPPNYATTLGA